MVSTETVRCSSLSKLSTSRRELGCKKQGNPTPGGVSQRASKKVHRFQVNTTQGRQLVKLTALMLFISPSMGVTKPWENEELFKEGRTPSKRDFAEYINEFPSTVVSRKIEVANMIPGWIEGMEYSERQRRSVKGIVLDTLEDKSVMTIADYAQLVLKKFNSNNKVFDELNPLVERTPQQRGRANRELAKQMAESEANAQNNRSGKKAQGAPLASVLAKKIAKSISDSEAASDTTESDAESTSRGTRNSPTNSGSSTPRTTTSSPFSYLIGETNEGREAYARSFDANKVDK